MDRLTEADGSAGRVGSSSAGAGTGDVSPARPAAGGLRSAVPRRRQRARRLLLLLHLLSVGTWLGLDVALGVLVLTAATLTPPSSTAALAAVAPVGTVPLTVAALASLVTGTVLALVSRYGLLRSWWVVVKLAINLVLAVLVVLVLPPLLADAAAAARSSLAGGPTPPVGVLLYPPVVSTSALVIATIISVYKPWGALRGRQPGGARPGR